MPQRTAFNPTEGPVVIDDEGRTLPGLTHGPVDPSCDAVTEALAGGRLVLVDTPKKGS